LVYAIEKPLARSVAPSSRVFHRRDEQKQQGRRKQTIIAEELIAQ